MTIEQRLAEIIQAFCADALSSAVNLNVDLDVVLCVLVLLTQDRGLQGFNDGTCAVHKGVQFRHHCPDLVFLFAHWCTILRSAAIVRRLMHPRCRRVTALLA